VQPSARRRPPILPLALMAGLLIACVVIGRFMPAEPKASSPLDGPTETQAHAPAGNGGCTWEAYFSPDGGCTAAVVSAIGQARQRVLVQAYYLTSAPVGKALRDAHKRGLDVRVILDAGQRGDGYSPAEFLSRSGIPTWIDTRQGLQHNKVIIVDGEVVITGSFNFTRSAEERNRENLLVLRDAALAAAYEANFARDQRASERHVGRR